MCRTDVQSAITQAFKRQFGSLKFTQNQTFSGVESVSGITLQREFDGVGEYKFEGEAMLCSECLILRYRISGIVKVSNNDETPEISFIGEISIDKK